MEDLTISSTEVLRALAEIFAQSYDDSDLLIEDNREETFEEYCIQETLSGQFNQMLERNGLTDTERYK